MLDLPVHPGIRCTLHLVSMATPSKAHRPPLLGPLLGVECCRHGKLFPFMTFLQRDAPKRMTSPWKKEDFEVHFSRCNLRSGSLVLLCCPALS